MGPYGLGLAHAPGPGVTDIGFWDLLDAEVLPNETAN